MEYRFDPPPPAQGYTRTGIIAGLREVASAALPVTVEHCHALIQTLRTQLATSKQRAVALEDQVNQYREQILNMELVQAAAQAQYADEVAALKARADAADAEATRLRAQLAEAKQGAPRAGGATARGLSPLDPTLSSPLPGILRSPAGGSAAPDSSSSFLVSRSLRFAPEPTVLGGGDNSVAAGAGLLGPEVPTTAAAAVAALAGLASDIRALDVSIAALAGGPTPLTSLGSPRAGGSSSSGWSFTAPVVSVPSFTSQPASDNSSNDPATLELMARQATLLAQERQLLALKSQSLHQRAAGLASSLLPIGAATAPASSLPLAMPSSSSSLHELRAIHAALGGGSTAAPAGQAPAPVATPAVGETGVGYTTPAPYGVTGVAAAVSPAPGFPLAHEQQWHSAHQHDPVPAEAEGVTEGGADNNDVDEDEAAEAEAAAAAAAAEAEYLGLLSVAPAVAAAAPEPESRQAAAARQVSRKRAAAAAAAASAAAAAAAAGGAAPTGATASAASHVPASTSPTGYIDYRNGTYPAPGQRVEVRPLPSPPAGGHTMYCPPSTGPWPEAMVFFAPIVELGYPVLKHGRAGRPHRRLLWLDISAPSSPCVVWQEGDVRDASRVKPKDRLPLVEIIDMRAGRDSQVLLRSGSAEGAGRYISFAAEARTLDIEFTTSEARDWFFRKFADLFQAYATAQTERLTGDAATARVAVLMDGRAPGGPPTPAPASAGGRSASAGRGGKQRGGAGAGAAAAAAARLVNGGSASSNTGDLY